MNNTNNNGQNSVATSANKVLGFRHLFGMEGTLNHSENKSVENLPMGDELYVNLNGEVYRLTRYSEDEYSIVSPKCDVIGDGAFSSTENVIIWANEILDSEYELLVRRENQNSVIKAARELVYKDGPRKFSIKNTNGEVREYTVSKTYGEDYSMVLTIGTDGFIKGMPIKISEVSLKTYTPILDIADQIGVALTKFYSGKLFI